MTLALPSDDLRFLASQSFWKGFRAKRILFTGASGFFGSWLLESYLAADAQWDLGGSALVLTRDAARFSEKLPHLASDPRVIVVEGDAAHFSAPPGKLDAIIHSLVPDPGPPLDECRAFFVQATERLLSLARESACTNFLLCSTGAVYQPQNPPRAVRETDDLVESAATGPLTYGAIRRETEDICLRAWKDEGIPVRIARCFSFVGPRLPLDGTFAVGNFLNDVIHGRPVEVLGDGNAVRSYLYAADLAAWLWAILIDAPAGSIHNVGSEVPTSIAEAATATASLTSPPAVVRIAGQKTSGAAPSYYVADTSLDREHLRFQTNTSFTEALKKTYVWQSEFP